ncbi:hypothetical protein GE061_007868 [Apolygus lucorum]|uniref:Gustatory receptor n=1 Tax=Apolygus lucorum TaxID=248454 RepID=A0A8S9WPQ8_APOLU|nr:hypothetical protein GE061_007868 [Apolygus lucorum]
MHRMLRTFFSALGVLPLASSNKLQLFLTIYSWTMTLFLISLANYYESQFVVRWITLGGNVVTGCISPVIDFFVYVPLVCHLRQCCRHREQCREFVGIAKSDGTFIATTSSVTIIITSALTYYAMTHLAAANEMSKFQLYKASIYVFLMYNCTIITLLFCAVLNALSSRINNLKNCLTVAATPSLLRFLDVRKDRVVTLMFSAVSLHSGFLLITTLDMFCRSVHYSYILLWAYLGSKDAFPFVNYLPFAAALVVKIMILVHMAKTCFDAKKSVEEFSSKMFDVVLMRWDLQQNEHVQLMVLRQHSIKFAPGGFFELGKRFMISMVNAIAVYLTVLVQVSNLKS